MHPLSFLQKRGHLSAVATGRKMFARVSAMTPARFDILYLIHEHGRRRGSRATAAMAHADLRRRLGLTRQTVWKLVVRLVELGLLEKQVDPHSRARRILVQLTDEGLTRIRQAYSAAFTERYPVPTEKLDSDGNVPRHVYRLVQEEARTADGIAAMFRSFKSLYDIGDLGISTAPPRIGREVAKVFTSFAWRRSGCGRRGRRARHLELLDSMIQDAIQIARALGDTSDLIYALDYEPDH
jgi:DNA-binding MarR family transcriptional regulator